MKADPKLPGNDQIVPKESKGLESKFKSQVEIMKLLTSLLERVVCEGHHYSDRIESLFKKLVRKLSMIYETLLTSWLWNIYYNGRWFIGVLSLRIEH